MEKTQKIQSNASSSNSVQNTSEQQPVSHKKYSERLTKSATQHRSTNNASSEEEKQFDEQVLHVDRVARVVRGGRRFRFRALVVIGDYKNKVGVGSAKGADVTSAIAKAVEVAKKQMITLPIYKETIPHDVEAKVGGSHILIKPASPGTGLIAGGVVRSILEVAGIHSALSKSLGSNNKTNAAYATIEALKCLIPPDEWITKKVNGSKSKAKNHQIKKSQSKPVPKTR